MEYFKLYNIKSFVETSEIELKPINIFVGRNSSGKSSLLRFPVVLSQTYKEDVYTPLLLFGNLIDYGNFDDVVYNHNGDYIEWGLKFKINKIKKDYSFLFDHFSKKEKDADFLNVLSKLYNDITIQVTVKKIQKKMIIDKFQLFVDDQRLIQFTYEEQKNYQFELYGIFRVDGITTLETPIVLKTIDVLFRKFIPRINDLNIRTVNELFNLFKLPSLHKNVVKSSDLIYIDEDFYEKISDSDAIKEEYFTELNQMKEIHKTILFADKLCTIINISLDESMDQITYIGPFRKNPDRIYRDTENNYRDVGKNGEFASMLLRRAQQDKGALLSDVSEWFTKSMGYSIKIEEIEHSNLYKVMVYSNETGIANNIIDVGYGVAQVLPIITQLYLDNTEGSDRRKTPRFSTNNRTYIIEQPELHLHPAAQANLADLFVEKYINEPDTKMLIETHSEHLIRKLQILVADSSNTLKPEDIGFYYIDKLENGSSIVKEIGINNNGQFTEQWPPGFFDKSYELSRELLKTVRGNMQK
ncbi:DUF3696 domain-containing protein [Bacillus thuringiensis]|nr:DUF3696 domain-containing protein [Bacillus thuringiensis]